MIFRRQLFKDILAGLFALFVVACSDSDQYLIDGTEPSETITVKAFLTTSFDSSATLFKADTIRPGDSLIFHTEVYPSKSIGHQRYFWLLDGKPFANEFSFRNCIQDIGTHQVVFVFIDTFGDTLSDTLSVTVAKPPVLDTSHFIPARRSQNIDPDSSLNFTWNTNDSASSSQTTYRFILKQSTERILVDTLINQPYFVYRYGFQPLDKYYWKVTAENEFHQKSEQTVEGNFFVKGAPQENALIGHIKTNSENKEFTYQLQLQDKDMNIVKEIATDDTVFNLAPISSGKYTLRVSIADRPNFSPVAHHFSIDGEQILELDTIRLYDNTPPAITTMDGGDTLDIADTLFFSIDDGGSGISGNMITVLYENSYLKDFSYSDKILKLPFDKDISSWTYKILSIFAIDYSGNKISKHFYLRPNTTLSEVFGE